MGLVFLAILLLWGVMALLVRITADSVSGGSQPAAPITQETDVASEPDGAPDFERRRRAAAAAVAAAVVLAQRRRAGSVQNRERQAALSPWQLVQRSSMLAQRANPPRKRGRK